MSREIFESEEHFKKVLTNCGFGLLVNDENIYLAKKHGYIRKNPVDEANKIIEENFDYVLATTKGGETHIRISNFKLLKLFNAIHYLKEKNVNE